MSEYFPYPLPAVGDRVHKIGPFPIPGELRAIVDGEAFVVRWFRRRHQCWEYSCFYKSEWRYGIWRPGPVPKKIDGRWPWETAP